MKYIKMVIQGMVIGLSMLIPGVSGGTMAVVMGIFDKLVIAIGTLFKNFKKSLLVLVPVGIGGVLGILLFSNPIVFMLDHFLVPTMFLFMGAVIGGLPALVKEAEINKKSIHLKNILLFVAGMAVVLLINFLPKDLLTLNADNYFANFIILFICGIVSSMAFVLPGISGSYMLLLLGMYDTMMRAVSTLDIPLLFPLGLGILLGILAIGRLLKFLLERHRQATYIVILGFIVVSVFELYPGVPKGLEWLWSILLFAGGFLIIFFVSRYEEKKKEKLAKNAPVEDVLDR
ncbi:DUF368 domain-containing protein [Ruminococcaceae bacterium OttesenSCG-928-I18]|nr:DUF368 domain-containing protein [Ruminococcaceae bacterium OttesenSCG-928-I18]